MVVFVPEVMKDVSLIAYMHTNMFSCLLLKSSYSTFHIH